MTDKVAQLEYWNTSNWREPEHSYQSEWFDSEADRKAEYTLEMARTKEGDSLLVLGCGPAYELWALGRTLKEGKITCIEPSDLIYKAEKIAKRVSKRYKTEINLIRGFAEDALDNIEDRFDDAIAMDVHRYLQDPVKVYEKTMNLVKDDNGIVVMNTILFPNHDCYKLIKNNAYDINPFEKLYSEHDIGISKFKHKIREFLFYLQKNVPKEIHGKYSKHLKGSKDIPSSIIPDMLPF